VDTEYDVELFPVIISRAEKTTLLVSSSPSKTEEREGGEKSAGIVALVGDASVTAHFRLGVGINNAFSSLVEIEEMVKSLRPMDEVKRHRVIGVKTKHSGGTVQQTQGNWWSLLSVFKGATFEADNTNRNYPCVGDLEGMV